MQPVNLITLMFAGPEMPALAAAPNALGAANGMDFMLALQQQLWMGQAPKATQTETSEAALAASLDSWFALETEPTAVPSSVSQSSTQPMLNLESLLAMIAQELTAILDSPSQGEFQLSTTTSTPSGTTTPQTGISGLSEPASRILLNWNTLASELMLALEQALPDGFRVSLDQPVVNPTSQASGQLPWVFTSNLTGTGSELANQTSDATLVSPWKQNGSAPLPASVKWFTQAGAIQPITVAATPGLNLGAVQAVAIPLADGQVLRLAVQQVPSTSGPAYDLRIELPGGGETISARLTISPVVDSAPVMTVTPLASPIPVKDQPPASPVLWTIRPLLDSVFQQPQTLTAGLASTDSAPLNAQWVRSQPTLGSQVPSASATLSAAAQLAVEAPAWALSLAGLNVFQDAEHSSQPIGPAGIEPSLALPLQPVEQDVRALRTAIPERLFGPGAAEPAVMPQAATVAVDLAAAPVVSLHGVAAISPVSSGVKSTAKLLPQPAVAAEPQLTGKSTLLREDSYPLVANQDEPVILSESQLRLLKPSAVDLFPNGQSSPQPSSRHTGAATGLTTDLSSDTQATVLPLQTSPNLTPHLLQFTDMQLEFKPLQTLQYLDLAQRVLDQAAAAKQAGNGLYSARLELNPPNLGQLFANISVRGEAVAVQLALVSSVPKEQLKDSLEALRRSLEQAGLNVVELKIVTLDPEQHQHNQQQREQEQPAPGQAEVSKTTPAVVNSVKSTPAMNW